jgi:hypothetical protein
MGLEDWNWRLPVELQDVPWDCAAASLTWCLNTIGRTETEADVVAGLGPARISPALGLLDASGAGLVEYLGELGIGAANNSNASFDDVLAAAGYQPMLMGGREWCHWVGVRICSPLFPSANDQVLALANPAPGWMGINQVLTRYEFLQLGAFSAVWFTSW